jgi:hypothetical protein
MVVGWDMVLALYVLAGVMTAGGLAAIYSGSDIIVMERGWTMVIAGSVIAAGGVLLGGIATAVARLQGLQGEFARLSDRLAGPQAGSFTPALDIAMERSASPQPSVPPRLAPAPDMVAHRDLDIRPEPILAPQPLEGPAAISMPAAAPPPEPSPPVAKRSPASDREAPAFERELAEMTEPDDVTEPPPPTVVGTYNSGGNFYIMYSDGSIEAETPAGKFRFDSLDELKDFIARGGDKKVAPA